MKIAPIALFAVLVAPLVAAPALAQSAKPKPINYDARAKACDAAVKGLYTFEQRLVVRGFCLSNTNHDTYAAWK